MCSRDNEIFINCGFGDNEINLFGGRDSAPPIIIITNPSASQTLINNVSINLNYSIIEYSPDKTCWFKVVDSSNNLEINNQTISNCANTTFNLPNSDSYNLTLYANDTFNNVNHSSVFFRVSLEAPAVNLNQPTDGQWLDYNTTVYFNFTATDFDGIENCELWSNFSGSWAFNENFTFITSGIQKSTTKNLSESIYKWNVRCIDNTDLSDFALNNFTVKIDLTNIPNVGGGGIIRESIIKEKEEGTVFQRIFVKNLVYIMIFIFILVSIIIILVTYDFRKMRLPKIPKIIPKV